MNDNIRRLLAQAYLEQADIRDTTKIAEKFAKLIVAECLDIASEVRGEPATDTHYVIGYDRACEKMIDGIKEHFGVEK